MQFDELNGSSASKLVRDESYPIRVTLQYYKSTDNGEITRDIMSAIAKQLQASRQGSDYVGSLVTEPKGDRPTEWVNSDDGNANDGYLESAFSFVKNKLFSSS